MDDENLAQVHEYFDDEEVRNGERKASREMFILTMLMAWDTRCD